MFDSAKFDQITFDGKRIITQTIEKLLQVKAKIVAIGKTILSSPSKGASQVSPITFEWYIPSNKWGKNLNFQLQVDKTDNTFQDLEADKKSWQDSGFEYWNGSEWVSVPVTGVNNSYHDNKARFSLNLSSGTKYWRVRAFAG